MTGEEWRFTEGEPIDDGLSTMRLLGGGDRHATERARPDAVDRNRRPSAGQARVAVGIAAGHDPDAHRPAGLKTGAIAHTIAGHQVLRANDP